MKSTKQKLKTAIVVYAVLRLIQALRHMIVCFFTRKRFLSSATAFSFAVTFCSFWFLAGASCERVVLLETGIVWIFLKFIAIAFQTVDLDFENDSFLNDSLGLNLIISSRKFVDFSFSFRIFKNPDFFLFSVLDFVALICVFKLRKILTKTEAEFTSEIDDKQFNQPDSQEPDQAVAFEPFLFTMMLEH